MANNWKDMLLNKQHHDPKDALVSADPSRFKKALRGTKYRIQGVGGFGGKRFVRKKGQFRRGLLALSAMAKKKQAAVEKVALMPGKHICADRLIPLITAHSCH